VLGVMEGRVPFVEPLEGLGRPAENLGGAAVIEEEVAISEAPPTNKGSGTRAAVPLEALSSFGKRRWACDRSPA
jgi:hypothetical protein